MAGTVSVQVSVSVNNPPLTLPFSASFSATQTNRGQAAAKFTLAADHSVSTITPAGLTAFGVAIFQNTGDITSADAIEIGACDGGGTIWPLVTLLRGETCVVRLTPGVVIKARTNSAETLTGALQVIANEK